MATPGHNKTTTGYPPPHNSATGDYSGGAAYPIAVPPPPSFYPSIYEEPRPTGFYQPPPPPPVMYSFLCRFLAAIAATMAVIALIIFITSLVLEPELPAFRIDSASVTSLNTTGPELTASFHITLVVTNPNRKLAISYDAVSASISYGEDGVLDSTRLPPFLQKTRSETTLQVQFAVVNDFVGNSVAKGISADRARGSVQFGVTLLSWIRFKSGIWRWNDHLLKMRDNKLSTLWKCSQRCKQQTESRNQN
ncbi:NDR1/HIN1-like protein 26 isoform X2 [Gastrolobium bilobum]|uniref:NDR1/HIN1-like protein 26 isoform X2 n=1 Tax=Gastrolobium bilobum TaxID=150636 RepID=UPI002AB2DB0D|nr:NDR1/HIN1-like protein 26 isoform X2 [Gastrolobium bilobum]